MLVLNENDTDELLRLEKLHLQDKSCVPSVEDAISLTKMFKRSSQIAPTTVGEEAVDLWAMQYAGVEYPPYTANSAMMAGPETWKETKKRYIVSDLVGPDNKSFLSTLMAPMSVDAFYLSLDYLRTCYHLQIQDNYRVTRQRVPHV